MHPIYLMPMHVYIVTCNFAKGPTTVVLKPSTLIPLCSVPKPYDKEKGSKIWFNHIGIRLGKLTIQ